MHYNYYLILLWVFYAGNLTVFAQTCDDFSDTLDGGNMIWTGDLTLFSTETNRLSLKGNNLSDTAYVSTSFYGVNYAAPVSWSFKFLLDFLPSNSNNFRFYLLSDTISLTTELNGYYIRLGENGSLDKLKLYRQSGTVSSLLYSTGFEGFGTQASGAVKVEISPEGVWSIWIDSLGIGNYFLDGTFAGETLSYTQFSSGFWCKHTATNSQKFHFDDFCFNTLPFVDSFPPLPMAVSTLNGHEISICFNEPIDVSSVLTDNFRLASIGENPQVCEMLESSDSCVVLRFYSAFVNGNRDSIYVYNIKDTAGNRLNSAVVDFRYFNPVPYAWRDVVINEILADPDPQIGLPFADYVELFNAGTQPVNLIGWTFSDNVVTRSLPEYFLMPGHYLVIADENEAYSFSLYDEVLLIPSFPSLNIEEDHLKLHDSTGGLIDEVNYKKNWHVGVVQQEGGYALEQINPYFLCSHKSNWTSSGHPINGGTPGELNDVFDASSEIPQLTGITLINDSILEIEFSEPLWPNFLETGIYINNSVQQANIVSLTNSKLQVYLSIPLQKDERSFIRIDNIISCAQDTVSFNFEVVNPIIPSIGDVVLNEILFNPFPYGSDFVEIFNASSHYLSLSGCYLSNGVTNKSLTANVLYPFSYLAFTTNIEAIVSNYNCDQENLRLMPVMPSYPDNEGIVLLKSRDSLELDKIVYNDNMHFPLISNTEGVSLERINPGTHVFNNWHSCTEQAGWATPGFQNSQYNVSQPTASFNAVPPFFSPNSDGHEDVTVLTLKTTPNSIVSIAIFDLKGRLIKNLISNFLMTDEAQFTWDGTDKDNLIVLNGIYLAKAEMFTAKGDIQHFITDITVFSRR